MAEKNGRSCGSSWLTGGCACGARGGASRVRRAEPDRGARRGLVLEAGGWDTDAYPGFHPERLMGSPQSLEELDSVAQGLGVPRGVSQERGCRGPNSGAHDFERKLCGHLSQFSPGPLPDRPA
jgi:hypothetical protein